MPDNELDRPFVVTYEFNELVVNMCALVMYHSKKLNELAELGSFLFRSAGKRQCKALCVHCGIADLAYSRCLG